MTDQNDQSVEEREMDIAQLIFSQLEAEAEEDEALQLPSSLDEEPPPEAVSRWDKSPTASVVRARKAHAPSVAPPSDGRLPETSILRKARVPKQVQALLDERQQQRISSTRAESAEETPEGRKGPKTRPNAAVTGPPSSPNHAKGAALSLSEESLSALRVTLASLCELDGYRACLLVTASSGGLLLSDLRAAPSLTDAEESTLRLLAQRYASTFEALFPSQAVLDKSSAPSELFVSFGAETHLVRRLDEQHIICMLVLEGAELNVGLARFRLNEIVAALQV